MESTAETLIYNDTVILQTLRQIEERAGFTPEDKLPINCITWTDRISQELLSDENTLPAEITKITLCDFPDAHVPHRWFEVEIKGVNGQEQSQRFVWDGSNQFLSGVDYLPYEQAVGVWNGFGKSESQTQLFPTPLQQ